MAYGSADSQLYQINPKDLRLNYGSSDYDLRHNFTAAYIWELPFKSDRRLVDAAIGGWEVSGTIFAHSLAFAFSVVDGNEALNLYDSNGAPDLGIYFAKVLAQPAKTIARTCTSTTTPCWKTLDFATSTGFGTIARNSFRGPGYFNTDFSIRKNFRLTDRINFQLGANAYNILNHPNFANPSNDLSSSNLGVITSTVTPPTSPYGAGASAAVDARVIQIVSKLIF